MTYCWKYIKSIEIRLVQWKHSIIFKYSYSSYKKLYLPTLVIVETVDKTKALQWLWHWFVTIRVITVLNIAHGFRYFHATGLSKSWFPFIVKWKTGRHSVWRWTCLVALSLTPKTVNNLQNTTQTYNNSCSRVLSGWPTLALTREQIFLHRFSYVLSFARDEPSSEPGAPNDIVWRPVLRRRVLQHRRAASRYLQVLQYPSSSPVGYRLSLLLLQAQHDTQFPDTTQCDISYHNILLHISSTARFLNTCLRVKEACCLHSWCWSSQSAFFGLIISRRWKQQSLPIDRVSYPRRLES